MKALKIAALVLVAYAAVVATFESLIGYLQPIHGYTLVIRTFDREGVPHDRVVSRLEFPPHLYVAANHWPRAWYHQALANPEVEVTLDGQRSRYRAVPVTGRERDVVDARFRLAPYVRFLSGYPPRRILRLDPL